MSSGPEAISFFLSPFFSFQGRNATDFGKNGEVEEFSVEFRGDEIEANFISGERDFGDINFTISS